MRTPQEIQMTKNELQTGWLFAMAFTFALLMIAPIPSSAQQAPPEGVVEIVSGAKSVTIPFELIGNHIVLPAKINGREIGMILDTGMPANGALLHAGPGGEMYGLQSVGKMPVMGADGGTM